MGFSKEHCWGRIQADRGEGVVIFHTNGLGSVLRSSERAAAVSPAPRTLQHCVVPIVTSPHSNHAGIPSVCSFGIGLTMYLLPTMCVKIGFYVHTINRGMKNVDVRFLLSRGY